MAWNTLHLGVIDNTAPRNVFYCPPGWNLATLSASELGELKRVCLFVYSMYSLNQSLTVEELEDMSSYCG